MFPEPETKLQEPLLESAPLARRLAPQLCRENPALGGNCAWYHGMWQDLRAMQLVMTPEYHAPFLLEAFGIFASRRNRARILISGAADYSLLAHVLWACGCNALAAEINVIDVCETPLHLNRWYADRAGVSIETQRSDIFDYRSPALFDLVCTHSFLGQYDLPDRARIARKWHELLRPGGMVVTANRLRKTGGQQKSGYSTDQVRAFRAAVLEKARQLRDALQCDPEETAQRAEIFGRYRGAYPVTFEEVAALFADAGFRINRLSRILSDDPHAGSAGTSGPPHQAEHACVVAERS